jgi:tryptophan-rich sensory protein
MDGIRVSRTRDALGLVGFVVLCFGTATLGNLATARSVMEWYPALAKPAWTPPNWVFGPVWTMLYGMMSIAGWLAWRDGRSRIAAPLLFLLQLALNGGWSWLFFGLRRPDLALVCVVLLWFAIAGTIVAFWRISRVAVILFVPYLAWVTFAAALNLAVVRMN